MRASARPYIFALCVANALMLTAGCTSAKHKTETVSPVPQITASNVDDQAVADATAALYRFYQVRYQCFATPQDVDSSCFDSVAVDQMLADDRATLENLQLEGWHSEGDVEVLSVDVVEIYPDSSFPQVRLAACVDRRTWRYVDDSGTPLVAEEDLPSTPRRIIWQLINYEYPSADQWKVSYRPEEESVPC